MATTYWVDGYNLIFRLKWQGTGNLESARQRLVKTLVGVGQPVVVWFDGTIAGDEESAPSPAGRVSIRFTRGRTADDEIVDALSRASERKAVTLVTDDRELRERARALGANTVKVDNFLHKLARTGTTAKPPRRERGRDAEGRPTGLAKGEVDEWMKAFGFDEEEGEIDLWDPDQKL